MNKCVGREMDTCTTCKNGRAHVVVHIVYDQKMLDY
jgi:hypothetical protein